MPGKWDSGEKVPHRSISSPVTSLHKLLHRTRTSGSTLNATPLLCRTDRAVTTCHLPQSHHGAWSYPKDPSYPSTTLVYEVTTLVSLGLPPFGWTSKTLPKTQRTSIRTRIIWPNQDLSTTHERTKHGLINYQDSKATMAQLYIMNRSLTSRIQSHTGSRGLPNDPEDDLLR